MADVDGASTPQIPLFSAGVLGPTRAKIAQDLLRTMYVENPLPIETRVALLCAALEDPDGTGAGLHATGLTLIGQPDPPIDLRAVWQRMSEDPDQRMLLQVTMRLGRGEEVPARAITDILRTMGPWGRAWQDLMVFAAWVDGLYRSQLPYVAPFGDARLEDWLACVVEAGSVLPS